MTEPDDWGASALFEQLRAVLRSQLASAMTSSHTSGDTVSSPVDAANYAIDYLLTEEGSLLIDAMKVVNRSRLMPGVIVEP